MDINPHQDAERAPVAQSMPVAEAMPAFTHRQILRVLFGILLCILLAAVDQTVVVPAVPAIAADLNGFSHLAWIVSAYLLTSTAGTPIYGKLSDIYGRRALLLPAIVIFMAASVLCALAQNLPQLIGARALQGVGGAGLMAMAQAAIADVVSPRERGRYQGYMAGTWAVASIAGPILGGWMTDHLSWRWIFWINLPIGAAAYILSSDALKLLRTHRHEARIDYLGAALLSGCATSCLLVLSWGGNEYPWLSLPVLGTGALAVLLLGALVVQERTDRDPLLPPRLFGNAVFSRGVATSALASAGMFGATFLLPLFFQLVRGADASLSGTLIVPFLGASCVGAFGAGQFGRRVGRTKAIILAGLGAASAGFALLATMGPETSHALSALYMIVVGTAIGACMPTTLVTIQNAVERRDVGAATGALLFLRSMGSAFGSTLVVAVLANRFAVNAREAGMATPPDLGALREAGGAALHLDQASQALAQLALSGAFHVAFAVCALMMAAAFAVCLGLPDLKLRSGH